jgi:lipoate-protein ligase A
MAVDEAILDGYAYGEAGSNPTLRLYSWRPATLSLGRSQQAVSSCDPRFLREQAIGLVRRPTGGRAVLHEAERTYALIGHLDVAPFAGGVLAAYRSIASALVSGLRGLGVDAGAGSSRARAPSPRDRSVGPACFDAPSAHEILAGTRKLVGSAQLRRGRAFLQHGSILLASDPERLSRAVGAEAAPGRFTDLTRLLGRRVDPREVDRALIASWSESFGARLEPGELTPEERHRATKLRCWKYSSAAWTMQGRLGRREERWAQSSQTTRAGCPSTPFHSVTSKRVASQGGEGCAGSAATTRSGTETTPSGE